MELLIRRDQSSGLLGGVKFQLSVRASLTNEELAAVKKYKMNGTTLYDASPDSRSGSVTSILINSFTVPRIEVKDLVEGKTIEVNSIMDVLSAEEQVKAAAKGFHNMLKAAATFGGETVHTFD